MEFHSLRAELLTELQLIAGVIEKKHTMPILANILIEAEGNQLTLKATDLEVGLISHCPAQVVEAGAFTVNAKRLQDMLATLSGQQVSLSMSEGSLLDVVSGAAQFSIETMPTHDFPSIPDYDFSNAVQLPCGFVLECIGRVLFSISSDPHKYAINGALWRLLEGQLTMVSTDGHRMSVLRSQQNAGDGDFDVIVPRKTMGELKKLLGSVDSDEPFLLAIIDGRLFFKIGDRVLFSRAIDGKFPDYEKAIPTNNDKEFVFERSVLSDVMRRKMVLSSDKSKLVRLGFSPNRLVVVLRNAERGESVDQIEIDYQGEAFDVGFNAEYVLDFLKNMSCERIRLFLKDATNQGLFRIADDLDEIQYEHVIMPMRLLG